MNTGLWTWRGQRKPCAYLHNTGFKRARDPGLFGPQRMPIVAWDMKWREMEGEAKGEIGGTYRKSVLTIAWGWVKDGAAPPCDAILALPLASAAFSSEANF